MADLNIYFLAVGRVQGEGIVVASHSNDSNVELSGVTQVIEQPTMNMQPGKHYSFDVGKKDSPSQAWHLISGTWNRFLYRDLIFLRKRKDSPLALTTPYQLFYGDLVFPRSTKDPPSTPRL